VWRIKFDALRCARKEVYKSKTEEFNATVKAKYSLQGRIGQLPRNETPATHADSTQLDNIDNRDIALNAVSEERLDDVMKHSIFEWFNDPDVKELMLQHLPQLLVQELCDDDDDDDMLTDANRTKDQGYECYGDSQEDTANAGQRNDSAK